MALRFAQEGADVAVNYPIHTTEEKAAAEDIAAEIEAMGRRAIVVECDISEEAQVQNMVKQVCPPHVDCHLRSQV